MRKIINTFMKVILIPFISNRGMYFMNKIKRKEEGVSPVISIILLVAITAVLVVTMYTMMPKPSESEDLLTGDLTYELDRSQSYEGNASFKVTMNTPSEISIGFVNFALLDSNSTKVGDTIKGNEISDTDPEFEQFNLIVKHIQSESGKLADGDRIEIRTDSNSPDISGYELVILIDGYTGQMSATVI